MNDKMNNHVRIAGTGSFLPGSPIPLDDVDYFLGEITEAPKKIRDWLQRMKLMMKEMLEVESYYYAIDPETREFTEDNVTMSVKASVKALEMAKIKAGDKLTVVTGENNGKIYCIALIKAEEFEETVRNILGTLSKQKL